MPRTCDRCYKIKAKCTYLEPSTVCTRCARLNHVCEVRRPVLQAGRPRSLNRDAQRSPRPKSESQSPILESPTGMLIVHEPLAHLKGFSQAEMSLFEYAIHPTQVGTLVYGNSFRFELRNEFIRQTVLDTDAVKDGFLALAEVISEKHNQKFLTDISHSRRSSNALWTLRHLVARNLEDVRTICGLALALITYNDLAVGAPMLPISRFALLQAKPFVAELLSSSSLDSNPHMVCLLFNEMFECIALQQRPVFRFEPPPNNQILDRYYGICHELLAFMYDISILYRAIKDGNCADFDEQVKDLEMQVNWWLPLERLNQRQSVITDEIETQHFLLQARAFKSAIQLLILQTKRTPFNDMLARSKATQLQSEITEAITLGVGRPKYLAFPYFVSCLELTDPTEDESVISSSLTEITNGMAPRSCASMVQLLLHISRNRKRSPDLTWFQCVDEGLSAAMGP